PLGRHRPGPGHLHSQRVLELPRCRRIQSCLIGICSRLADAPADRGAAVACSRTTRATPAARGRETHSRAATAPRRVHTVDPRIVAPKGETWAALSPCGSGHALVAGKHWPATGAAVPGRPAAPPIRATIVAATGDDLSDPRAPTRPHVRD